MNVKVKDLRDFINTLDEEAELKIGWGKKEYNVEDMFVVKGDVVCATAGYAEWKKSEDIII